MELGIPEFTSKADLFAMLTDAGHCPSDDQIDRFRLAGIVDGFVALPGRGAERFASRESVERLVIIYRAIDRLGLKKPRPSELAYWLAYEGYYVPKNLIVDHLTRSINGFISMLYRELGRRGAIALTSLSSRAVSRLAARFNRAVLAFSRVEQGVVSGALLHMVVRATLGVALRKENYAAVSLPFRRALVPVIGERAASDGARVLWDILAEFSLFFIDSPTNPLRLAVDQYKGDTISSGHVCSDSRLLLAVASDVFPWLTTPELVENDSFKLSAGDRQMIARYLPPLVTAMLLTLRENTYTINLLDQLRSGRSDLSVTDLAQMATIASLLRDVPPEGVI